MNIDPTGLETTFKKYLRTSETNYNNASSLVSSIKMPNDFSSVSPSSIYEALENLLGELSSLITETDSYIEGLKEANGNTGAEVERTTGFFDGFLSVFNNPEKVSLAPDAYEKEQAILRQEAKETIETLGATTTNLGLAALQGLASAGEAISDGITYSWAWYQEKVNIAGGYLIGLANPQFGNALSNYGKEKREDLAEYVESDHTENAFNSIIATDFFKAINEASVVKYNDAIYNFFSGITYYTPMVIADAMLPGAGTALSFLGGQGNATEEALHQMKLGSKDGIISEYQLGKMSKEEYQMYDTIWNMSDEEYQNFIRLEYAKGKMDEEVYHTIEMIREMPDEWNTLENSDKAMYVGVANGVWEATQWQVGKTLNNMKVLGGSKALASGARVAIDTLFNASDTFYRSAVEATALEKTFNEVFNKLGGWEAVGLNTAIGLAGSLIGEAADWGKSNLNENLKLANELSELGVDVRISEGKVQFVLSEHTEITADNLTPTQRIEFAKKKVSGYFKERTQSGITDAQIESAFSNITIFETMDEFRAFIAAQGGGNAAVAAANVDGHIYCSPETTVAEIIHEADHSLGAIRSPDGKVDISADGGKYRGINEAATEYLALKQSETKGYGSSLYKDNVKLLDRLYTILGDKGHPDMELSYYDNCRNKRLAETLKEITGDDQWFEDFSTKMNQIDLQSLPSMPEIDFEALGKMSPEAQVKFFDEMDEVSGIIEKEIGLKDTRIVEANAMLTVLENMLSGGGK